MKNFTSSANAIKISAIILFMHFSGVGRSQTADSVEPISHFSGSVGLTNNGLSVVPTFSFDKPTAILLISATRKRLSFEPDFRFSLDLKHGGLGLWWRYKILPGGRFKLNAGVQNSVNYAVTTDPVRQGSRNIKQIQQFLAAELVPSFMITENLSVGLYYLYAHGLQLNGPRNVHFLTVNSNISNIKIPGQIFLQWTPQFYYLNIDGNNGIYFTSTATLSKRNSPFSLQSTINKTIKTNIPDDKNFVWNVTLFYAFKG
jgi:hypothetical protein